MKNKPWYVWLSLFALFGLLAVSILQYFPAGNKRDNTWGLWFSLCGNIFFTWFVLFMLPVGIIMALAALIRVSLNLDFNVAETFFILVCMYFLGINAVCKHLKWRDKHR